MDRSGVSFAAALGAVLALGVCFIPAWRAQFVRQSAPSAQDGDLYAILGVSKASSDADIKKLYRRLALRWHPDKATPSERDAHASAFEAISRAHSILTDPLERRIYDKLGEDGVRRWRDGDQTAHPDYTHGVFDKEAPPVPASAAPGWDLMDEGISSVFAWLEHAMVQLRPQPGSDARTQDGGWAGDGGGGRGGRSWSGGGARSSGERGSSRGKKGGEEGRGRGSGDAERGGAGASSGGVGDGGDSHGGPTEQGRHNKSKKKGQGKGSKKGRAGAGEGAAGARGKQGEGMLGKNKSLWHKLDTWQFALLVCLPASLLVLLATLYFSA